MESLQEREGGSRRGGDTVTRASAIFAVLAPEAQCTFLEHLAETRDWTTGPVLLGPEDCAALATDDQRARVRLRALHGV